MHMTISIAKLSFPLSHPGKSTLSHSNILDPSLLSVSKHEFQLYAYLHTYLSFLRHHECFRMNKGYHNYSRSFIFSLKFYQYLAFLFFTTLYRYSKDDCLSSASVLNAMDSAFWEQLLIFFQPRITVFKDKLSHQETMLDLLP